MTTAAAVAVGQRCDGGQLVQLGDADLLAHLYRLEGGKLLDHIVDHIGFAEQLAAFKPLVGVHGNCDGQELRYDNPLFRVFDCAGMKVLMTHIGGYPGHYDRRALALIEEHRPDIFVCGHSHILRVMNDRKRGFIVINPGAAGEYGFHTVRTALRFHIDQGSIHDMEVYELARKQAVL